MHLKTMRLKGENTNDGCGIYTIDGVGDDIF